MLSTKVYDTYESWLIERGIESSPAPLAGGLLFSDVYEDSHSLLMATCSKEEPKVDELKAMLQKLAQAIGVRTSVVLTSPEVDSSRVLLSMHKSLRRVIVLGASWASDVKRNGIEAQRTELAWIFGPEASEILTDASAKRNFWNHLKPHLT